ncbi:ATP-dependent helicase [Angustibacter sp. Root456]|uniref:ATP-dependent helicase n=1 Tax=Angustibacter sp. Root456 TaxID=1736539 RepID=UPI00351985DD
MLRRERLVPTSRTLDVEQLAAVEHRGSALSLIGAPGSGKTTTLVEAVAHRVEHDGLDAGTVLVLAPTRLAAARLRELVTGRLAVTVREPLARTPQSFAFGVLRQAAALSGEPAPRLITGPEQDVVLRELLAGHAMGHGRDPAWPPDLLPAIGTRAFRGQLRDLLMRAVERGVSPSELAALGRRHRRPEWVAAAGVLREYLDVTALSTPGGYDPAAITAEAAARMAGDAELLERVRAQVQFVAVDDAHELTAAAADLLRLVVGTRPSLLLAGDADAVTQSFRGADPDFLLDPVREPGAAAPTVVRLRTSWRQPPALRAVSRRVADAIGARGGAAHRLLVERPDAGTAPGAREHGRAEVHVLRSAAHEVAFVADRLRRAHLSDGVPWSRMAVLVRGRQRAASLRRGLQQSGVPVDVPLTEVPVRDQTAVVPLLDAYEAVLRLVAGEPALDAEGAVSLLMSPLGGADAIAVRRLRQALRAEELGAGDGERARSSDELLVEALLEPGRLGSIESLTADPATRVARVLAAGVAAMTSGAEGATAETLLWAIWSASGLGGPWQRAALAGGASGARADRDLDAVVALFDAATRFVDRLPQAGAREFIEYLRGQDVAADTLAERAAGEAVALLTPASAAGREWDVVVVAGVQDGVWPDLRLRGSLLGAERLVDVLAGREPSLRSDLLAVRDDETRLLHVAVSRSRAALLVTAVRDDDEQPSPFVDLVDPPPEALPAAGWDADGVRTITLPTHPLTLAGVVARLRQQVCGGGPAAGAAARRLARLAAEGVPGAHPDDWYGVAELTDDRPLATDGPVRVSPSKVEAFERCGLRWLLTAAGGTAPTSASQGLGTLVHDLADELPDADAETLLAELRRRWHVLGWGEGFAGDVQRERAERVVRKLADYLAGAPELVASELDVDVVLDLPHGQARVVGRVDRLERDGDGLHVIDLKTGKQAPAAKELPQQPQLGAYQLLGLAGAFADHAPDVPVAGAALVQLGGTEKKPKVQRQEALPDGGGWAVELLDRVAHGMAQHQFVATVNDLCDRCPVRSSCPARPEGRQVTS